jgi:hypothetical protein
MITLENKVVLVRANGDYPENSPKKWIVLVGEIVLDEELKVEKMVEGEAYAVDFLNAVCSMSSWSGIVPSGAFKHHLLLKGEHFDIRQGENGEMIAIVGTIKQEPTPVNPELELDAE